ncbi:zinc finger protein [Trichonephila inaurata madagascariensis]|uniref:Zinc finger protein n=1 Tax=Trichonephila inaurata madagascariensis TaxID=2747483 RepID=A0A8X6X7F1_9ARAC|nr:zinc finger protein [Trichonephila inaurata madagascariensis]
MDKTTGKYGCQSCQMQFKDFKQYLYHKYEKHDEPDLQPEINKDGASSTKKFENTKLTGTSSDNFNQPLDLSVRKMIQFLPDESTEDTRVPSCPRNVTEYREEVCSGYQSNPDDSKNDPLLLFKYSQNDMVSFDMNTQRSTNQSSISFEYNPLESHLQRINETFHPNQLPVSEHRQMQLLRQRNNEHLNVIESTTSSGIRPINKGFPQVSTTPFSVSLVDSQIQSNACEMTQNFNTNQRMMTSEWENFLFSMHETNLQSSVDQRVAKEVRDQDSLVKSDISPANSGVNEMNINFEKYFKSIGKNLDCAGRLYYTRRAKTPKKKECFDEKISNVPSINQYENVAQNKTSTSNSPLEKNSDSSSEEISAQNERSRNVLHNKRDQVRNQYHNKNTRVFESGEMNLEENSNLSRYNRAGIKIKPRNCEKCENIFNEELHPMEISANQNRNKSEFCKEKFRSKNSVMKQKERHTADKKSNLHLRKKKVIRQRGQNDHDVIHTRERPDKLDQLKIGINQASTSSGIRHISERFPQIDTDPYAVSLGNRGVDATIEINEHWNTNQQSMSSEKRLEFTTQGMDPQSSANQRAVRYFNDISLPERLLSSPRARVNKMNQTLKTYSEGSWIKLDSVGRSTITFEDGKDTNTEYLDPCGAYIPSIRQNKIEAQNIISASNSSLKHHFNVQSEEISKKHESCRGSLNNESNLVQPHHKDEYAN